MSPDYDRWFFLKMYDLNEIPSVEIWIYQVYARGAEVLVATGYTWGDFLRGKKNKMMLSAQGKQPLWYFTVPTSNTTRVYYIESIKDNQHGTSVKLTGQHQKKIEEFKADIVALEDISKVYTKLTLENVRLKADKKKDAIEEGAKLAEAYVKKILVAMRLIDAEKEETPPEQTN